MKTEVLVIEFNPGDCSEKQAESRLKSYAKKNGYTLLSSLKVEALAKNSVLKKGSFLAEKK